MSKHHFVAVGGTGQHVALGYADLAVLAEWFSPREATTFWLLDADASGGNIKSAWDELLSQAAFLRRHNAVNRLQWPDPNDNHQKPFLDVPNKRSFGQIVDEELGVVFFNEQQRGVGYTDGYFGHAAVASTIFGAILHELGMNAEHEGAAGGAGQATTPRRPSRLGGNSARLRTLLTAPRENAEARVVVAGSAVGGTGSGCVPRIVEQLSRSMEGRKPLALLYLPWFKLEGTPEAILRNQDMSARMASGLLYYRDSLQNDAAAVLIGHPNVGGTNRPRKWQGDTRQATHDEMTLPMYGALVAAQYFDAGKPTPAGLYSVVRPPAENDASLVLSPHAPTSTFDPQVARAHSIGRLWEQNAEWLRRVLWVAAYLADQPAARVPRLTGRLDIPALSGGSQEWVRTLHDWAHAKWRALKRIGEAFPGGDALPGGPQVPRSATWDPQAFRHAMGLTGGIDEIRGWLNDRPTTPEDLAALLASRIEIKEVNAEEASLTSQARLLPPRVGTASGRAEPEKGRVGTAVKLAPEHAQDLIDGEQVSAYAVPNTRAREFVLRCIFSGSILPGIRIGEVLEKRSGRKDAEELLARWVSVLTLLASGAAKLGNELVPSGGDVDLVRQLKDAMPDSPWEHAREIVWVPRAGGRVVVGHTSRHTLVVPSALSEMQWGEISAALDPATTDRVHETLRAWGRFLGVLSKAARVGAAPGWLPVLAEWGTNLGHRTFGFGIKVEVEWGGKHVQVPLPTHGGRADAGWGNFFTALGIPCAAEVPAGDPVAQEVDAVLAQSPVFWYHPESGDAQKRRGVWVLSGANEKNRKVGQVVQERYYVSPGARQVWDIAASGLNVPIEILGDNVLLDRVGYIQAGDSTRYPDLPVDEAYVDLVDLSGGPPRPARSGDRVEYKLKLRGLGERSHAASIEPELALKANCLLWPNFTAAQWRSRYALVDTASPDTLIRVYGRDGDGSLAASVRKEIGRDHRHPKPLPDLPDHAIEPAAIAVRHRSRPGRTGLYAVNLERVDPDRGKERWGIDFGTTGTVIAVNPGNSIAEARLLQPNGACDATHVVALGDPLLLKESFWFPTWDGTKPRGEATGTLPSRMVLRRPVPDVAEFMGVPENFGPGWMLDYGGPMESIGAEFIVEGFKWRGSSSLRIAYLTRLLEQAAAWRARTPLGSARDGADRRARLPAAVELVVTLPLRMHADRVRFEEDIGKVCKHLTTLTGIEFTASFLWESLAGATPESARHANIVYAALDLGGGSLDLWGSFAKADGAGLGGWINRSESLLLGGEDFLRIAKVQSNAAHAFRSMSRSDKVWKILPDTATTRRLFFELVSEACARWLVALSHDASGNGAKWTELHVGFLGRAWALGGQDWAERETALQLIEARMHELGFVGTLVVNTLIEAGQEERKSYLARYASNYLGRTMHGLESQPVGETFAGVTLSQSGDTAIDWRTRLPSRIGAGAMHVTADPTWNPAHTPGRLFQQAVTEVNGHLNEREGDNGLATKMLLRKSPFYDLLERLVKGA